MKGEVKCQFGLMNQEKCNFHYKGREQVRSQIRNCRNEEGEILDDLIRENGIVWVTPYSITKRRSRKRKLLCLFLEKSSKDVNIDSICIILSTCA